MSGDNSYLKSQNYDYDSIYLGHLESTNTKKKYREETNNGGIEVIPLTDAQLKIASLDLPAAIVREELGGREVEAIPDIECKVLYKQIKNKFRKVSTHSALGRAVQPRLSRKEMYGYSKESWFPDAEPDGRYSVAKVQEALNKNVFNKKKIK